MGGSWRYRIHRSVFYKELAARYSNIDEVVRLAERQVLGQPTVDRAIAAIDEVTAEPMTFYSEPVTPKDVAGLVKFRMHVFGMGEAAQRMAWEYGGTRFDELIIERLTELGRVPIEMEG